MYFLEIKDLVHLGQQTLVQKLAQKRCTVRFVETVATDRQREGGNPQQSRIPQLEGEQLRRAPGKEESWTPLRGAPPPGFQVPTLLETLFLTSPRIQLLWPRGQISD